MSHTSKDRLAHPLRLLHCFACTPHCSTELAVSPTLSEVPTNSWFKKRACTHVLGFDSHTHALCPRPRSRSVTTCHQARQVHRRVSSYLCTTTNNRSRRIKARKQRGKLRIMTQALSEMRRTRQKKDWRTKAGLGAECDPVERGARARSECEARPGWHGSRERNKERRTVSSLSCGANKMFSALRQGQMRYSAPILRPRERKSEFCLPLFFSQHARQSCDWVSVMR